MRNIFSRAERRGNRFHRVKGIRKVINVNIKGAQRAAGLAKKTEGKVKRLFSCECCGKVIGKKEYRMWSRQCVDCRFDEAFNGMEVTGYWEDEFDENAATAAYVCCECGESISKDEYDLQAHRCESCYLDTEIGF